MRALTHQPVSNYHAHAEHDAHDSVVKFPFWMTRMVLNLKELSEMLRYYFMKLTSRHYEQKK